MFGIGLSEIILIIIIAVIFVEPEKLPGLAKAVGKAFIEFRRAGNELKRNIKEAEAEIMEQAKSPKAESRATPEEAKGQEAPVRAEKDGGETPEKKA